MISVVIPYLSGLSNLKKCISSIKKQFFDAEIIVVNDSEKRLKLNGVIIINNSKNMGAAFSRNKGLERASNELVMFADHDITFKSGSINLMIKAIKNADIVFPKIIYENGVVMHPVGEEQLFPQISACFMVKKSSIKLMDEFFDANYKLYLEDSDFFFRAKMFGLSSLYVCNATIIHKLKPGYNNNRFFLETKNLIYGFLKFLFIKNKFYHPFRLRFIISNFFCGLFNFDKFDRSHFDCSLSETKKFYLLFKSHRKLSDKGSLFLLFEFFRAFFSAVFKINIIFKKRSLMKRLLIKVKKEKEN